MAMRHRFFSAASHWAATIKPGAVASEKTGNAALACRREVIGLAFAESKFDASNAFKALKTIAAARSRLDVAVSCKELSAGTSKACMAKSTARVDLVAGFGKTASQPIVIRPRPSLRIEGC